MRPKECGRGNDSRARARRGIKCTTRKGKIRLMASACVKRSFFSILVDFFILGRARCGDLVFIDIKWYCAIRWCNEGILSMSFFYIYIKK